MERPCLIGPKNETIEEISGPFGEWRDDQLDRPLWRKSDEEPVGPSEDSNDEEDVGPFGETRDEEEVGPFGESRDEEDVGPFGESRDEEDVGAFGESRDEEDVGPFGESRDEDQDSLHQCHEEVEENEVVSFEGNMTALMQLAAKSVGMLSGASADTEGASSSHATTALPTEPHAPLASSSTLASSPSTPSRKRARNSEHDAYDEESPSMQKRMRMDDILGIVRDDTNATTSTPSRKRSRDSENDAYDEGSPSQQKRMRMDEILGIVRHDSNAAVAPQSVSAATTPEAKDCRKRAGTFDDDSEDGMAKPTRKRLRLYQHIKETPEDDKDCIATGGAEVAEDDEPALVNQDTSSDEAEEGEMFEKSPMSIQSYNQPAVDDETSNSDEAEEREDISADNEAAGAERDWDTAHGINSTCANIPIPGKIVGDLTGVWRHLYLPTSTGLPDRAWNEDEKEDLRVYIQDYGIEDWALLSQSTNRPVKDLKYTYYYYIKARNIQAGRPELAGLPERYPNFARPLPAREEPASEEENPEEENPEEENPEEENPEEDEAEEDEPEEDESEEDESEEDEPRNLRSLDQIGKSKKHKLGDLTYDVKATSFPKVTKGGGTVDAKGNVLLGIMGDISHITKRRQQKLKQEFRESLPSAGNSANNAPSQAKTMAADPKQPPVEVLWPPNSLECQSLLDLRVVVCREMQQG